MDAASAYPFQINVPDILKGHGRHGKGVRGRTLQKTVKVVGGRLRCGAFLLLRGAVTRCGPLAFDKGFGSVGAFAGGSGAAVAGTALYGKALESAVFTHQIVGME
jgi:hypothetical protein